MFCFSTLFFPRSCRLGVLSAVCAIALLGTGSMPACATTDKTADEPVNNSPETLYRQLNLFGDVLEKVRTDYVDEVSDEKLIEHALHGLLTNLDPHSDYLNDADFKDMQVQTRGEFGGLGIEVTLDNGVVKVVSPIDDTPAFRAGVKAGDYVTHLDGKAIVGIPLSEAVDQMRGKPGTSIDLTIRREGASGPIILSIKRDIIKIVAVRHRIEGDVGYLRVTTFNRNTYDLLKESIAAAEKNDPSVVGYVLDLRNNPGGLLDQAIDVADAFLEQGEIVSTRGRHKKDTKRDRASAGDLINGKPIVVLINGGSASASEIVAGALQDHRRGIVVGTKSFGKGSVQTVIPVPGHGAIRLTTARYYTPSGRSIQAKGIEPDILIEPAKLEKLDNTGLSEADLQGALKNPDQPDTSKKLDDTQLKELDRLREKSKEEREGNAHPKLSDETQNDYQLLRAIDLVRGLALYAPAGIPSLGDRKTEAAPPTPDQGGPSARESGE